MKVSNKKKALPGVLKFFLLCTQHICAAYMVLMLVFMALSIGIVGNGTPDGDTFYGLNPFEKTETFEESSTFYEIFNDYVEKVALDTVISSQFGTTGEIDHNTIIDVTVYANRKNELAQTDKIHANYRLDDLLKWGMYGMSYQPYSIESLSDIYAFFPDMEEEYGHYSYVELFKLIYQTAIDNSMECRDFYNESEVPAMTIYLPVERYTPVGEADSLLKLTDDWFEYCSLVGKLKNTISDLSINLETYQKMHEVLKRDATNFRYCIEVVDEEGYMSTFSNMEFSESANDENVKQIGEVYFIWNRNDIFYDTNMPTEVYEYISNVFSRYEYALGEQVKICFAVDGSYEVQDAFKMGAEKYVITKDMGLYIGIAAGCGIVWLGLFLYLSVMTGRKKVDGETQIVLNWFDYVPTEIAITIFGGVVALVTVLLMEIANAAGDFMTWYSYEEDDMVLLCFSFGAAALSILITFFWYSMLRRFKARTVLKHSLIWRFLAWIGRGIAKVVNVIKVQIQYIYNHSSDGAKIIWPVLILIVLHFVFAPIAGVLLVQGFDYGGPEGVLGLLIYGVLFVIDAWVAILLIRNKVARTEIIEHIKRIAQGEIDIRLTEEGYKGENHSLAQAVNNIGNGIKSAVETSMKDERMKADLITNVSHDIKTPLTSIINYVDLLKREHIETDPVKGYIEVLDAKSQRLKQLTDDLVEASKISSGNIVLHMDRINLAELLKQSVGEFSEKFEEKNFTIVENYGDKAHLVYADPRRMWRVIENLFNNIYKYGLEGTRVYIDITPNKFGEKNQVLLSIKNISSTQLCVRPEELTERFVRGDDSRTTEGSGLGLSIAKSLVEAQGGALNIILDGDLFKIVILFEEALLPEEKLQDNEL